MQQYNKQYITISTEASQVIMVREIGLAKENRLRKKNWTERKLCRTAREGPGEIQTPNRFRVTHQPKISCIMSHYIGIILTVFVLAQVDLHKIDLHKIDLHKIVLHKLIYID